tara:strand:+ start:43 stop:300 length:258 start_codon:yes stop_codon:yes gene_type:complete
MQGNLNKPHVSYEENFYIVQPYWFSDDDDLVELLDLREYNFLEFSKAVEKLKELQADKPSRSDQMRLIKVKALYLYEDITTEQKG